MGNAITIEKLSKTFKTKQKEQGLIGSLKSIIKTRYKEVKAVNKISFNIKEGELVAFIGPNGAGKSTTLKMLSGILFSDEGKIKVLGMDPQKQRIKLSYKIGVIFGQKPQLWYHLPAIDSFNLFAKIYDLEKEEYQKRLKRLISLFDIRGYINTPVRKLSLGQRMRCEFVLALLHNPKVLFLDEPTIGMDTVIKRNIRSLIRKLNKEEGLTILLTSHDMEDIKHICKRAIIINHGRIIYDGKLKDIIKKFATKKIVDVLFQTKLEKDFKYKKAQLIKQGRYGVKLEVDTKKTKVKTLIDFLIKNYKLKDINIQDPPIEEIIEEIYKHGYRKIR